MRIDYYTAEGATWACIHTGNSLSPFSHYFLGTVNKERNQLHMYEILAAVAWQ